MRITEMRIGYSLARCPVFLLGALGAAAGNVDTQSTGSCDLPPASYSQKYKVDQVSVRSPFDYLHGVRSQMLAALGTAQVKPNDDFQLQAVVQDRRRISERLHQTALQLDLPVTIDVVTVEITNCRDTLTPPKLDVVYRAFASWFPFRPAGALPSGAAEAQDPAQAAGVARDRWRFIPRGGYNRTARLFGGLRSSAQTPLGAFDIDGFASTATAFAALSNSGQHAWESGWIQNLEWRTGYVYSDAPTGRGRLKEGHAATQFAATSAPLGAAGVLMRFGAALGGGHQQATLPAAGLPAGSALNNPAGDLTTYAGMSLRAGRHLFKASYGLKLGESAAGARIDFAKHIADAALDFRFLPRDHLPVELGARFTAGVIQNLGAVPVVERFFGGNQEQELLPGDSWGIRSGPFIRSIPQNRLDRLAPEAAVGGERFLSANFTLGIPVWHRPLVPDEIGAHPDFAPLLEGELKSARTTLRQYWNSKDPAVLEALKCGPAAAEGVTEIRKQFDNAGDSVSADLAERFSDCDFQVTLAEGLVEELAGQPGVSRRFNAVSSLIAPDDDGSIDRLAACLGDLRGAFPPGFSDAMRARLTGIQKEIRAALAKIDESAAQGKTDRDMSFITRTVATLIHELNLASVSPIAAFDIARIGPQPAGAGGGFRYGIGGGARFALLDALRLTAGYAFNPNPKPWEGRGAAFFSMEIVSLFR